MADEDSPRRRSRRRSDTQRPRLDEVEYDDRTRIASDTFVGSVYHPIHAAVRSMVLWGSGLVYVEQGIAASVVLLVSLWLATMFATLAGLAPSWVSEPFFRGFQNLGWNPAVGDGLTVFGFALILTWWVSLVGATALALRSLPYSFQPTGRRSFLALSTMVPAFGWYVRGKFWWGHIDALFLMLGLVGAVSAGGVWKEAALVSVEAAWALEPFFMAFLLLTGIALAGLFGMIALRAWQLAVQFAWSPIQLERRRTGVAYYAFGLPLLVILVGYFFAGSPGRLIQGNGFALARRVEAQQLQWTAGMIRKPFAAWKRKADTTVEFLSLFQ